VDNDDSSSDNPNLGQIRVSVPQIYGVDAPIEELPWAKPSFPMGGGKIVEGIESDERTTSYGFVSIPPLEALVWIQFVNGDPSSPVYVGTFYAQTGRESDAPSEAIRDEQGSSAKYPNIFLIKPPYSSTGMWLRFLDNERLELVSENGKTFISINRADGKMEVKAEDEDIIVSSANGKVELVSGEVSTWKGYVDYSEGDVVKSGGEFYRAIGRSIGVSPTSNENASTYWTEIEDEDYETDRKQSIAFDPTTKEMNIIAKRFTLRADDIRIVASEDNIRFQAPKGGAFCFAKHASGFEQH